MHSREIISNDLRSLGLKEGDVVIVHSSLSSMGSVDGGAETVILALEDVIGSEGTLLFPAFTYASVYGGEAYDPQNTKVCVGKIPETFRSMPEVIRSFHPTHSVAARGKYADEITRDHKLDNTPLGKNSPYAKLAKYNAKILMLGCSLNSTSYMHALEEEAKVPYALTPAPVVYKIKDGENVYEKEYFKHNFSRKIAPVAQKYARCIDVIKEGEDYFVGEIHGAKSYLIDAVALHDAALKKMAEDPYYFVGVTNLETYKTDLSLCGNEEYDVIILAGQSNAVGYGSGETDEPFIQSDDILEISDPYPITLYTAENGRRMLDMPFPPDLYFGRAKERFAYSRLNACLANRFAEDYVKCGHLNPGRKLLIVKTAVGGTGFTKRQWTEDGQCRQKMIHMIGEMKKLSNNMKVVALLWHQGEQDAGDRPEIPANERQEFYFNEFGEFVSRVRGILGNDFPIICGEFTPPWMAKNKESCNAVLTAMKRVLENDGYGTVVSSEGAEVNDEATGNGDILHFSRNGIHLLGRRYFEAFKKLTKKK